MDGEDSGNVVGSACGIVEGHLKIYKKYKVTHTHTDLFNNTIFVEGLKAEYSPRAVRKVKRERYIAKILN